MDHACWETTDFSSLRVFSQMQLHYLPEGDISQAEAFESSNQTFWNKNLISNADLDAL